MQQLMQHTKINTGKDFSECCNCCIKIYEITKLLIRENKARITRLNTRHAPA